MTEHEDTPPEREDTPPEREDLTPGEDEAPDSGFEEEREEWVREHPDDPESGGDEESPPAPAPEGSDRPGSGPEAPDPSRSEGSDPPGSGPEAPDPSRSDPSSALEQDIDELREKARERDEYLSLAQRTQADFENYRKRVSRDIAAAEGKGVAKLARELLPALDNLAIALRSGEPGTEFVKGIELVNAELNAALERLGVEAYSPHGEPFDPNVHEAMAKQPVDGAKPGTVVEVYQRGYRLNGTILRPARVVVAE